MNIKTGVLDKNGIEIEAGHLVRVDEFDGGYFRVPSYNARVVPYTREARPGSQLCRLDGFALNKQPGVWTPVISLLNESNGTYDPQVENPCKQYEILQ